MKTITKQVKAKTIFQKIKELEIEFSNYRSDLFIPANKITSELIDSYEFKQNVTTFINEVNGKLYYEVPFAYDIFWKRG